MADDKHTQPEVDRLTGIATTGHEWDGIKELNTPLPRWWLWTFYVTIVWAIGYMVVYPAIPLISSHTVGLFGYTNRAAVQVELDKLQAQRNAQAAGLADATFEQIKANPDLNRIALARGKAAFGDNCMGCHGAGGMGFVGYPNLADDDWIWGGKPEQIQQTILHGIRWDQNTETRVGNMPAFGRTGMLKRDEIAESVEYVRSLAGLDVEKTANLAKGKEVFAANCASCHGDEGKGNQELGAPSLTDAIWLYGNSRAAMTEGLVNGRAGAMPAWSGRLDAVTIKALTVYVGSLGGGQ
ncbi:MAG: cytochrome-c oxidase, cbb3-type subunit III [Beijerinckiaceae bacterium]|jgi:cytochrome c oxidase cbb3-type subunit 3|nr:cytochrome-c oxidase, cbb3-type subunit III [Beijerinckiaceae bacterium]